jgi:hypothetical protein
MSTALGGHAASFKDSPSLLLASDAALPFLGVGCYPNFSLGWA